MCVWVSNATNNNNNNNIDNPNIDNPNINISDTNNSNDNDTTNSIKGRHGATCCDLFQGMAYTARLGRLPLDKKKFLEEKGRGRSSFATAECAR